MAEPAQTIDSLDSLRAFVHNVLCAKENLVEEQFRMAEAPLLMGGTRCGLQFTIHGPRSVRLSAVWAADANMVYFYDARGERFLKLQVADRFEWPAAA